MSEFSRRYSEYRNENGEHASPVSFLLQQDFVVSPDVTHLSDDEVETYVDKDVMPADTAAFLKAWGITFFVADIPGKPGAGIIVEPDSIMGSVERLFPEEDAEGRMKAVWTALDDVAHGRFYENWGDALGIDPEVRPDY